MLLSVFGDIGSELPSLIASGSVGSYLALGLYGLCAVLILVGFMKGFGEGMARMFVRLLTVIGSAVLSGILCLKAYPLFLTWCDGKTLADVFSFLKLDMIFAAHTGFLSWIGDLTGDGLILLSVIPVCYLALPILFGMSFIILSALMLPIQALICWIFGLKKHRNNELTRLLGALIGLVQGAFVAAIVLIPVFGVTGYVAQTVRELPADAASAVVYQEYLMPADTGALAQLSHIAGGDYVMGRFTAVTLGDKTISPEDMVTAAAKIRKGQKALADTDFSALTETDKETVRALIDAVDDDESMQELLTECLLCFSEKIVAKKAYLPVEEPFATFAAEAIAQLENTDPSTVTADLSTLSEVYFLLSDSGVLAEVKAGDLSAAKTALESTGEGTQTVAERVAALLAGNAHTASLGSAFDAFVDSLDE